MRQVVLLTLSFIIMATVANPESSGVVDFYNFSPTLPLSVKPQNSLHLKNVFEDSGYSWETLDKGVPPVLLQSLPTDLHLLPTIAEKKDIFLLSLLPMILLANEQIERQRLELKSYVRKHDSGETLSSEDRIRLASLVSEYDLNGDPLVDKRLRRRLLERVDIIPPSLALAQAANESAWGTSRFSRQANNLFGEWTYERGAGLVPYNRPVGSTHEIRRFDSIYSSITSYIMNLNTHRAYRDLRKERYRLRSEGLPIRGIDLANGLTKYSERREGYVRDIKRIIRQNGLSKLSSVKLRRSEADRKELVQNSSSQSSKRYSRNSSLGIDP